jgi:thioredoxin-related protein
VKLLHGFWKKRQLLLILKKKTMKTIALLSFIFLTGLSSFAQKAAKEELVWHTDLNKAIEVANKENKPMMLFFTGSDWCGWCMKLQKEVFTQSEFKKWAQDNVVLVEVDFPRANIQTEEVKTQNRMLQQQFAVRGYPTCWFITADKLKDGKVNFTQLGQKGYEAGGPVNWINGATTIIKPN